MADAIAVILATCGSNEEASKLVKAAEDVQDNSIALLANVKGALRLANPEQAKRLMAATKTAVEAIPTFLESAKNQRKNMVSYFFYIYVTRRLPILPKRLEILMKKS